MGKLVFFGFLMISKILDFFDFFGFWGVVWKFWREALGLSWEFSVGCKDSSGLVGFDYDGLHFFTPPPPLLKYSGSLWNVRDAL